MLHYVLHAIFHWRFSGVLIPLFWGTGLALGGIGVAYEDVDAPFYFAWFFLFCGAAWAAGYWVTSDFLASHRPRPRHRGRSQRQTLAQHRTLQIAGCVAIVICFGVSAAGVQWLRHRKWLERLEGYLIPANDPMPSSPCGPTPSIAFMVFYGSSAAFVDHFPFTAIEAHGESVVAIHSTDDRIALDVVARGDDGRIVAKISKNAYVVNRNNYLRMKRPDKSTLVVEDQSGREAFTIRYLNRRAVKLTGVFSFSPRRAVEITEDSLTIPIGTQFVRNCFSGRRGIVVN